MFCFSQVKAVARSWHRCILAHLVFVPCSVVPLSVLPHFEPCASRYPIPLLRTEYSVFAQPLRRANSRCTILHTVAGQSIPLLQSKLPRSTSQPINLTTSISGHHPWHIDPTAPRHTCQSLSLCVFASPHGSVERGCRAAWLCRH